jgi:predicted outer membrane repeat protein
MYFVRYCLSAGLLTLMLFSTALGPARVASAAGVVGDGTPGSCTEAALTTALAGGGAVSFNCGGPKTILILSAKTIAQDTTISGGNAITLTGGLATRLFNVNSGATLVLRDIALDSAFSNGSDGGAISNNGTLYLEHSVIQFSQTDINHSGGAIFSSGPVFISDSTLKNNTGGSGGAIFANFGNAKVTVSNSTFTNNQAVNTTFGYGGAIWVGSLAELTFTDGTLSANSAQTGGALYISPNGSATLVGSSDNPVSITSNSSKFDGGAIYSEAGTLNIAHANVIGNKTPTSTIGIGYGGAIASLGTMTLSDGYLALNEGRFGGAVFVGGSLAAAQATIDHTIFSQNTAGSLGGGLYTNVETTTITVSDSVFNRNTAATGGGIGRFAAKLRVNNSSITQNTATSGAGLWVSSGPAPSVGGYVEVHDTTISTNTASSGQGGGVYNSGLLNLQSTTIKDNTNGIFNFGNGEVMRIVNSVLQNPNSLNCDGDGTLPSSAGGNFSTDNSCAFTALKDQQGVGLDPKLGPLTVDTFNITFYHMPQAGSPLINAATPECSPQDQRHALRSGTCDIGAVEFGGLLPRIYAPLIMR